MHDVVIRSFIISVLLEQLRTQALASLHAGLQNNQGLPASHVAKWLAMEVHFFLT